MSARIRNLDSEQTQNRLRAREIAPGLDPETAVIGDHESTLTPAAVDEILTAAPDQGDPRAPRGFLAVLVAGAAVWILAGLLIWHTLRR